MQAKIDQNIISIKNRINAACEAIRKNPDEVTLIAVSKKKDIEMIKAAIKNGVCNFGEN